HGHPDDRFVARAVTDEVMYEIMLLSGQEYVDEYADRVKERVAQGPAPAPEASPRPGQSERSRR
ncbi:MAG: 1-acyl-sn-glycerol-3-phosphate acyltransferase, partial [Actinomycetota bacterium]